MCLTGYRNLRLRSSTFWTSNVWRFSQDWLRKAGAVSGQSKKTNSCSGPRIRIFEATTLLTTICSVPVYYLIYQNFCLYFRNRMISGVKLYQEYRENVWIKITSWVQAVSGRILWNPRTLKPKSHTYLGTTVKIKDGQFLNKTRTHCLRRISSCNVSFY